MAKQKHWIWACVPFCPIVLSCIPIFLFLQWHTIRVFWRVLAISLTEHALILGAFFIYYYHPKSKRGIPYGKCKRCDPWNWWWRPYLIHVRPVRLLKCRLHNRVIRGFIVARLILWLLVVSPFYNLFNAFPLRVFGVLAFCHEPDAFGSEPFDACIFPSKRDKERYHYDIDWRQIALYIAWPLLLALVWLYPDNDWLNSAARVAAGWRVIGLITYTSAMVFFHRYGIYTGLVSNVRTLIMLILNYLEIVVCFSVLYLSSGSIKLSECGNILQCPIDALYFSVVTITTLGYGDFQPIDVWGRVLVSSEVVVGLLFVLLVFANFLQRASERPGR